MNAPYAAVTLALLCATAANAAPIMPTSYDLRNGHGTASSGSLNYWDKNYTGAGSTITDNALLTGGLGDLTDGVVASDIWFDVENLAGTGPYVGWRHSVNVAPTVTFRFAGPVSLDSLTIYADDSDGFGGVDVPSSVDIGLEGGPLTNHALVDPAGPDQAAFTLNALGLVGSAFDVRFNYTNEWIFISEVTFDGQATDVPEPSIVALMLGGALGLGLRRRSRAR